MNSLFQQLNPTKPLPANITNMIKQFKNISNPHAMLQQIIQENPRLSSIMQAANGDPEKAFRDLAKQMNVDPEEIIKAMRNA